MIVHNRICTLISFFLAAIVLLTAAMECRAACYRTDRNVFVRSQYTDLYDPATSSTRTWKVVPATVAGGTLTLQFFLDETVARTPVCTLEIAASGPVDRIKWQGAGSSKEKTGDKGFLLVPGYPAPCNVLPVGNISGQGRYQDRTEAGGSVFINTYLVSSQAVDPAEAAANGWIDNTMPDAGELLMVTVTDESGQVVVRQLWPVDGFWWIYEETSVRRSWQIN